ncbi:GNAT family N-acetyltransferase [uncultured Friedmanniella sp.]|uniref:GNAT family N-acetyltransferase n=1 Tax=uncultured Friedmanniella sp. TaxID=335381 RepID=UPI0035CBA94A
MPTAPHLAELELSYATSGRPEDFVAAAMRVFSIDFDEETWPSRGVFEPERSFGFRVDGRWVSTCTAYSRSLTVPGGATLPSAAVTFVTVAPSYRRRGLLNQMMRHQLDDTVARGEPVALLWASEAAIYGRYGYGTAAGSLAVSGATGDLVFRADVDLGSGSVGEVDLADWRAAVEPLHARLLPERPGALTRSALWWDSATSDAPIRRGGASAFRFALHYARSGAVDGYLAFRTRGAGSGVVSADLQVGVAELDATNAASYARLWRFVFDLDLVRTVRATLPVDDPLPYLLRDADALGSARGESLFARLVDLPRALEARRYAVPVDLVLGVRDSVLPQNNGAFRLRGGPDGAEVSRVQDDPDVTLDVRDLATLYLGGTPATVLQRAGLVTEHTVGAVAQLSAAFAWNRLPFCLDYF